MRGGKRRNVRHKTRERNSDHDPLVSPVMKLVRGFGPGHPRCRSSPHSHRPPPPGSPRNAPVRSILLTRHRCTRSARYRSTRETNERIDVGRLIGSRSSSSSAWKLPFYSPSRVTPRRNSDTSIHEVDRSVHTRVSVYKRNSLPDSKLIYAINKSRDVSQNDVLVFLF